MEEFLKKYKLYPTKKLLRILEESENYQRMAVLAAEIELDTRAVSQEEIDIVKKEVQREKAHLARKAAENKAAKEKAKSMGEEFFKTISPIQVEPQTTNRKINAILICLVFLSIVALIENYGFFQYSFYLGENGIDPAIIAIFLFTLVPLITTPLWGLRKKTGWILLAFHLITIITGSIISFFASLSRWLNLKFIYKDPSTVDFETTQISFVGNPIQHLVIVALFLGFLWFISQPDIKKVFKIERQTAIYTFGIASFISILMRILLF